MIPAASRVCHGSEALDMLDDRAAFLDSVGAACVARPVLLRAWAACMPEWCPLAVEVRRDGNPVALAALAVRGPRRRSGALWTEVDVLGGDQVDYAPVFVLDDAAAVLLAGALAALLRDRCRRPWLLRLPQLPRSSRFVAELARLLPAADTGPGQVTPRLRIGSDRSLPANTSRNFRRSARSGWHAMRRDGVAARIDVVDDETGMSAALDEVVALRRERDHQSGRRSHLDDPRMDRFYRTACLSLAREGYASCVLLRAGTGELLAYALNLLDGDTVRAWDGRVAPAALAYNAARVCDLWMIESVLAGIQVDEIDWMRGDSANKRQVSNDIVEHVTVVAASSAAVSALHDGLARARSRAKAAVPVAMRARAINLLSNR